MSDDKLILMAVKAGIAVHIGAKNMSDQLSIDALRRLFTQINMEVKNGNS